MPVVRYQDGSGHCKLTDRFDKSLDGPGTKAQLDAQAAYDRLGAKGEKWGKTGNTAR